MSTRSFHGVRVVRFGEFELDVRAGELRQGERKIRLQDQPRRILAMLLERPGDVVLREEICKRLWPNGTVVEVSHGINAAVLRLRDALGDSAENPRFVETVARRGYRFVAAVEVVSKRVPSLPGEPPAALQGAFDTEALAGQSISHFRLEQKLGRGGMGVVYRAVDLSLGRPVALKFLAAELAGDPAAVGRFQREARLASALNHPNICTVYAVEECVGQPAIVMELLEGRTLEAMLAAGPMSAEQALPLAIQMAAALDAAHRKMIVHRDLKPGNAMVTRSCLKVLDFGLAKQSVTGDARAADITRADSILGTPTYMAPEQFQGKEADARSDIYSLGMVLWEMLTGCRAADHPKHRLPAAAADVEPVVRRALEANPEDRWQTARDLKAALEWVLAARAAHPPVSTAQAAPLRAATPLPAATPLRAATPLLAATPLPATNPLLAPRGHGFLLRHWKPAVAGFLAALLAVAGLGYLRDFWVSTRMPKTTAREAPPAPAAPMRAVFPGKLPEASALSKSVRLLDFGTPVTGRLNLSPDGKLLAYTSGGQIFVRTLDGGDTRLVASENGIAGTPFWSPDGRWLAFTHQGKLLKVDARGGPATPIGDASTNLAGAWGPDGTILIGAMGDGLMAIPASGGAARKATTLDSARGETRHLSPQFLPGGRKYLYTAGSNKTGEGALYAGSLDAPDRTAIVKIDSSASFVPRAGGKGYLIFDRGEYLMAQAFDAATLHTEGQAFPLAGPIGGTRAAQATALTIPEFSATPATLVYRRVGGPQQRLLPVAMVGGKTENEPASGAGVIVLKDWMTRLGH